MRFYSRYGILALTFCNLIALMGTPLCRADQAESEAFWIKRAQTLDEQKRGREAEALYQEILRRNPRSRDGHYFLGEHYGDQGRFALMEKEMRQLVTLDPGNDHAQVRLAAAFLMQSRWVDAESASRQSLKLNPKNGDAWEILGSTFAHRGRDREAIAAFEKAVRLSSNMVDAYYNLCDYYVEQKKYRPAVRMAEEFISRHPGRYVTMERHLRRQLTGLYPLVGESRKGEALCRTLLKENANDGLLHNNLALALVHLGKRAEARREWQQALRLGRDQETITEAKTMLAKYPAL